MRNYLMLIMGPNPIYSMYSQVWVEFTRVLPTPNLNLTNYIKKVQIWQGQSLGYNLNGPYRALYAFVGAIRGDRWANNRN